MRAPRGGTSRLAICALALFAACADEPAEYGEITQALQPVNSLPPPQAINEDTPLFFSAIGGNEITVSDPDNATTTVQIIVTNGTFTLGDDTQGLTVSGDGTFSVTLSGTIGDVNAGLDGARYQPDANYNGPATLQMNTSDTNGETDLDVLSITVAAVNDPPVDNVPAGVQAATEDVPRAFTLSITDVDVLGAPMAVTLTASNATTITLPTTAGLTFTSGDGDADATMAFSGTLPDVNAALNGLVVTPPLNYIGASTLIITSNDQGATGAGSPGADNDTITLSWAAVNDAPVNTVPGAQALVEEGSLTFSGGNAIGVGDVDASTALVQVTLTASSGVVTLGSPGLVTFTVGDGTADATMTFNATLANLNAALAGTGYATAPNFAGAATLTVVSNDLGNVGAGGAKTDTDVITLNVSAVNDPPLNSVPGPQATTEDVPRIFSIGNGNLITVGDPDATSLQVTLTATNGTATLSQITGLSFLAGDGTADATMTFSGAVANLNSALAGSRFTPLPHASGAGSLAVTTSDLGATGAGGTLTDDDTIAITITPVNDPPTAVGDAATLAEDAAPTAIAVLANDTAAPDAGETLTVTAVGAPLHGSASTNGTTVTYTPAANYHGTDSVGYTISDGNGGTASATIALTITSVNDDPTAVDDSFSVVSNSVGNSFATLSNDSAAPDTGETLTITAVGTPLHGTATITTANTRISYTPTGGYSGPDTFTYTISDGNGGADTATITVDVVAVITEPVNSLPPPQTIVEDSPLTFTGSNAITVADSNNTSLTVQILVTNGTFALGSVTGLTVSGNGTASVTASGTIANLNTGLNNARYTPTADYFGPATLTINSSDTNGESDLDALSLTVTSFNDAPINAVPAGVQAATEDTPRAFTLSITDVDVSGAPVAVQLTASNATLITLPTIAGLTFTAGDGAADATMSFNGTLPDVNAALNGLVVTPPANYIGSSTLAMASSDQGATGAGPVGVDSDTINLTWSAVNDAPINTVPGGQALAEDGAVTFSAANGNALAVADDDAATALVQITLTASSGVVNLGNPGVVAFTVGDGTADATMTFSATLANLNSALSGTSYVAAANFNGAATLTMVANDLGNVGSGGAKTDTDVVGLTISAVNDAPVNTVPGPQVTSEDVPRIFSTGNGNLITVGDPDASSLQVTLTADAGTATLGAVAGLSFLAGDGTADVTMTFSGTIASVNAALSGARFTPNANVGGVGSLAISTSDLGATGAGGPRSDDDLIAITISPVNDPPTAVNDTGTLAEDAAATAFAVLANDTAAPDTGETLTVTAVGTPLHGAASTNGTTVTYTPAANYHGPDSVGYTISDGNGGTASATLSLTITSVNDDPTAADDAFSVVSNSVGNSFATLSNDSIAPDAGETLTITAVSDPPNGTTTITSGGTRISYTPDGGFSGADAFTYTISDGNGGLDTATVSVDVVAIITEPVNSLPGPQTIVEDSPLFFSTGGGNAISVSDANNTSLTVQILVTNGIFTLSGTTGLTVNGNGTSAVTASGTITNLNAALNNSRYNPTLDFFGPASLTINSSDTNGESDLDLLSLSVTSFNDPPVNTVPGGVQAATEDTPRTFATISVSDVDLSGADLRLTLTANNGTLITLASTGALAFTVGDGSADPTMTFTGALPNINVALNGLTITAPNSYIGPSTLVVTSNDLGNTGAGPVGSDTDTINLTWAAVNDPPINAVSGPITISEDTSATFASGSGTALTVSDADVAAGTMQVQLTATNGVLTLGDPGAVLFTAGDGVGDTTMTFRANLATINAALNGTTFTPTTNFAGSATVTMVSNDLGNTGGPAQSDTDAVTITVTGINDAPVNTVPGPQSTNEDIQRVFSNGLGNPIVLADSDATALQVTLNAINGTITLQGVAGLTFQAGDGTADPTMTFAGTIAACNTALNGVRFIPTPNFVGVGTLTVSTSDLGGTGAGGPLVDEDAISISVLTVNDNPDAVNDTAPAMAEDSLGIDLDVLANDTTAPDLGETLTIIGTSVPARGTATIVAGGTRVRYVPTPDTFGADSFTYTVSDGNGGSDTATVSITVTAVNDPPNAVDDTFSVAESSTNNVLAVRANDSALPDTGETLTVTAVTPPVHGTAAITGTGANTAITYTPAAGYFGADSLTYTLSDPSGATDTAIVTINVTAVSTTPLAGDDTLIVAEDGVGVATVLANDTGLGDTPITVTPSLPAALHGTITVLGDNTIRYTPAANYSGMDTFGYTVTDAEGDADTGLVTVTVTPTDDLPTAVDDARTTDEDTSIDIVVLANDTGTVDNPIGVVVSTGALHGTASVTGTMISYVPDPDYHGTDSFEYTLSDADGDASIAEVTITINPINDVPVAFDDLIATRIDEALDAAVLANDVDVDGDTLVVLSVTQPASGVVSINGDGTVRYTPAAGFMGTVMFDYVVSDGVGGQDSGAVQVAVGVDSDGDGLLDVDELETHGTDPQDEDTDNDDLEDGQEILTAGTDPLDDDTDDDGLLDGSEDTAGDGPDAGETDANNADTDDDGVQDGTEAGLGAPEGDDTEPGTFVPDADPSTTTDPVDEDTDDGGTIDGDEDLDGNGRIDGGETDPNDPSDDPGPPDSDGDGVFDDDDNCPDAYNANQADEDGDGVGDRCDDDFVEPEEPGGCCDAGGGDPTGAATLALLVALALSGAWRPLDSRSPGGERGARDERGPQLR